MGVSISRCEGGGCVRGATRGSALLVLHDALGGAGHRPAMGRQRRNERKRVLHRYLYVRLRSTRRTGNKGRAIAAAGNGQGAGVDSAPQTVQVVGDVGVGCRTSAGKFRAVGSSYHCEAGALAGRVRNPIISEKRAAEI